MFYFYYTNKCTNKKHDNRNGFQQNELQNHVLLTTQFLNTFLSRYISSYYLGNANKTKKERQNERKREREGKSEREKGGERERMK